MKKLCYHDLLAQLRKNPHLTPGETLEQLRVWIDQIAEEYGNLPLGLLQAYAYILKLMEKEGK